MAETETAGAHARRARSGGFFSSTAAWRRTVWGDVAGEFLGTFVLIAFGVGSVAMTVAALNQSGRGTMPFDASGDWLVIVWGWGFAVTFGVYVAGGVTGAHINPAVTLAFALRRDFPWRKVPAYWAAQVAGAFVGAAMAYGVYGASIDSFERANNITRGALNSVPTFSIFATFPAKYFGAWPGPFIDQVVGTGLLVMLIFALVDKLNTPPAANMAPFVIGFVVVAIGLSFGANAGYAINPARDLGPRLWALIEGWGKIAVPGDYGNVNSYMWIPIVGPLVGGALGAYVYDFFIRDVLRARGQEPEPELEDRGTASREIRPGEPPEGIPGDARAPGAPPSQQPPPPSPPRGGYAGSS